MKIYLVLKVSVVSVVSDEVMVDVVLINSIISVVRAKTIFPVVSKISVVSIVSDEIIFHVVLNMSVVSVVRVIIWYLKSA